MKSPSIKLCGFQSESDVAKAIVYPIDALGFILVPNRKRTVSPQKLKSMVDQVPTSMWTVGVLMDPSLTEIQQWLSIVPLSAIQLHGDESPEFCRQVKKRYPHLRLIKTIHMQQSTVSEIIRSYQGVIDVILLDSAVGGQKGGTGKRFDWSVIPAFEVISRSVQLPLWIAGGIHADNVHQLIKSFHPQGIDVSSGIERADSKDQEQIRQLVERVKQIDEVC